MEEFSSSVIELDSPSFGGSVGLASSAPPSSGVDEFDAPVGSVSSAGVNRLDSTSGVDGFDSPMVSVSAGVDGFDSTSESLSCASSESVSVIAWGSARSKSLTSSVAAFRLRLWSLSR